jgi:Protein of unknown function (DUF2809)
MSATSTDTKSARPPRVQTMTRVSLCAAVIVLGLALRGFGLGLGLPAGIVKYGGSVLWATMVFLLVVITCPRLQGRNAALLSITIAIGVELSRLVHTPWLDAFRLTLPGALLLGRIFSLWNVLAYGIGIIFALLLDQLAAAALAKRSFSRRRLAAVDGDDLAGKK